MMDPLVVVGPEDRLAPFAEANQRKIPWDKRVDLIHEKFPSIAKVDWYKVFREDPALLGRLINDILKVDAAQPGKPGKRPAVVSGDGHIRLRQIMGEDFTSLPFTEAFKMLVGDRSIRAVAAKTGLDRNHVHRLLNGGSPSARQMEQIARGFKKEPGFFAEYRLTYIAAVLQHKLESVPDSTIGFYQKLKNRAQST